jgi:hypothetical protein
VHNARTKTIERMNAYKESKFILICFILALLSFTNKADNYCDNLLQEKKYIERDVSILKVDPYLIPFLDTIVKSELECEYYDSCQSGFLYSMKDYVFLSDTTLDIHPSDLILINSQNIYTYDYKNCYGVFEYSKVRFICDNSCNKRYLTKTDKSIKIKYIEIKKEIYIDDRWSDWSLLLKDQNLIIFQHHPCYKKQSI